MPVLAVPGHHGRHDRVAGLALLECAYRTIRIAPTLLPDLDDASTWHETPYGKVSAGWRRAGDLVHFRAEDHPRPAPASALLNLSSGLAEIIDDPEAYQAVLTAIRATDRNGPRCSAAPPAGPPAVSSASHSTRAPLHVLEAIEKALAALLRRSGY